MRTTNESHVIPLLLAFAVALPCGIAFGQLGAANPFPWFSAVASLAFLLAWHEGRAIATEQQEEQPPDPRFDSAGIAILEIDEDGLVARANPAAHDLFRAEPHALEGRAVDRFFEDAPPDWTLRRATRQTRVVCANGSRRTIEVSYNALWHDDSRSVIAYLRDVTDQERLQAELVDARDEAQRTAKQTTEFLAVMSHEIRTPMNGVVGAAQLLGHTDLTDNQLRLGRTILEAAGSLRRLLDDILDFSKAEAGRMALELVSVDLWGLMDQLEDLFVPTAQKRRLVLDLRIDRWVPERVVTDPVRLRQVLVNLIGNAVKFTPEGGSVVVGVRTENVTADHVRIRFRVDDTGIGISPEQTERIFEAFTQAESSTTRQYGGTGLGLAISRKLVDLLGGELELISAEGRGSSFTFALDLEVADPSLATELPPTEVALAGLRVLLVDDGEINRLVGRGLCEALGCIVETASNGVEAVEAVQRQSYDAVLMDWRMPVMDGIEATQRIRALDANHDVFIAAMTANAMERDRRLCLEAGMDAFLTKPVEQAELSRVLREAIGFKTGTQPMGPQGVNRAPSTST